METLQQLTVQQLVEKIELCDFECIAGPLTMSNHWKELRSRFTKNVTCEERDRYKADSEALDWIIENNLLMDEVCSSRDMPVHLRNQLKG